MDLDPLCFLFYCSCDEKGIEWQKARGKCVKAEMYINLTLLLFCKEFHKNEAHPVASADVTRFSPNLVKPF